VRRPELDEALRKAGVPAHLYALPPLRDPERGLESYFFVVEQSGGFQVGIHERGKNRIGYRTESERQACQHLYDELVFETPPPRRLSADERKQARERSREVTELVGPAARLAMQTAGAAVVPHMLEPGLIVDQFGQESGTYLYPLGTPFDQRSLPPSVLNTTDPRFPYGYHRYEVVRPFRVRAGIVTRAFGQPGGGIQFKVEPTFLPEQPALLSILWLLRRGFLRRIEPD
jgi:hypothetical protein